MRLDSIIQSWALEQPPRLTNEKKRAFSLTVQRMQYQRIDGRLIM